jgi:outer membrane protein
MKYVFILALSLSANRVSFSQTHLLHVKDAISLAETSNPELACARAQPQLKKADKYLSEAAMMPQISGFAAGDYNARLPVQPIPAEIFGGPAGTYQELRFGLPYNLSTGFDFNIPVIKANQWFDQLAAKTEWKRSESEADQAAETIRLRTAQAYFSYLAAKQALGLSESRLSTAKEVSRISERNFAEGRSTEADNIRAQNLSRAAEIALNNAQMELGNALRNLSVLLNTQQLTVQDSLEVYITGSAGIMPSIQERPSFVVNQLRMESLGRQSQSRMADFFPSLSLSGRYAYYLQSDNPFKNSDGNVTYDQAIIGARLSIPIFGGAKNYARLKQANILLKIASWQADAEKLRLEKEHADITAEQQTLYEKYRLAEERRIQAKRAEQLMLKRYEEGLSGFSAYAETFYEHIQTEQEALQTAARLAYINYLPTLLKYK